MAGYTFLFGLSIAAVLTNAQSSGIPPSSLCPSANGRTITDRNGNAYLVTCSADNDRGSYTNAEASTSYLNCMTACDAAAPKCVGFTYVGGTHGRMLMSGIVLVQGC